MPESVDPLKTVYDLWSKKPQELIEYDIRAAERKARTILAGLPELAQIKLDSVLDLGCGYGRFIEIISRKLGARNCCGADFSDTAIKIAKQRFGAKGLSFIHLPSFDPEDCVALLRAKGSTEFDCIALIDLLEHVPDCIALIKVLSSITRYFLVKLPIERSFFDNYILPKEYPSTRHSDGHLREFDVDTVHYFIRKIGLTPVREGLYIYDIEDMFPPLSGTLRLRPRLIRKMLIAFKWACSKLLPKRLYLRWVGGGGYYCLATFDARHLLNP